MDLGRGGALVVAALLGGAVLLTGCRESAPPAATAGAPAPRPADRPPASAPPRPARKPPAKPPASKTPPPERGTWGAGGGVSEADVGLRFYPGASGENGGRGGVRRDSPGAWAVVELTTPDPFDKVVAFYRSAYGRGNQVVRRGDSFIIILPGPEHVRTVTVTRGEGVSLTRIMLSYGRP